jgi:hypothetical protein
MIIEVEIIVEDVEDDNITKSIIPRKSYGFLVL